MTTTPILQVAGIAKQYGKFTVLNGVDLRVIPGAIHSVIGSNSVGRTVLFHVLMGTRMIASGTIALDGHDVTYEVSHQRVQRGIARSFRVMNLFPSLPVRENLCPAALSTTPYRALHG